SMEGAMRNALRPIRVDGEAESTDRLYRNEGNGFFANISREAGILIEGYGLGVAACDLNQDGWTDIYCSDDFISNDLLWINNRDGTFTESAGEYFSHFTNSGMGMDIADFNNDGLLDVLVMDMLPVSNVRQKLMIPYRNTGKFYSGLELGYLPQFLRNTLQLNQGKFKDGKYRFSEIGFLSGIYQTDWSWAPLFADFDNDGWKDLLITNGFRKDVTNLDYINKIIERSQFGNEESHQQFFVNAMKDLPDVKLPNYIFRNNGNLLFSDKSEEWGLIHPTFTNGTAYADLDNDGDLDIILNNIDQEVTLYENQLRSNKNMAKDHDYLTIRFQKSIRDHEKIGLKVWIYQPDNRQYYEYSPYRGYKSTVDPDIHVGLGRSGKIDSLVFQWNDGTIQNINDPSINRILEILKSSGKSTVDSSHIISFIAAKSEINFENITDELSVKYKHEEAPSNDFLVTPTLLHSLSKYGPSITIGDINQDGLDDFFIGADARRHSNFFLQNADHTFSRKVFPADSMYEDMGSLLFDADDDSDLDLYVVSGGYHWADGSAQYQDHLYFNDGKGNFHLNEKALPKIQSSGSCVIAGDYDQDGDLDLFIGGRVKGRNYPLTPQSYLLENRRGIFVDRSEMLGNRKGKLGMVTSALWTDVNSDNTLDLLVVGEWMPITILLSKNGAFINETVGYNLEETSGWWNSINGADLDQDGDIDYILGNYGLNSFFKCSRERPIEIYSGDFDRNGTNDPIITHYIGDDAYIIHPYNILTELIPGIKNRFRTYSDYGNTPFKNAFTPEELAQTIRMNCKTMESVVLENLGEDGFTIHSLPTEVQFAPVFGILVDDVNSDYLPDLILVGNSLSEETITGYYDASLGNVLINNGNFKWKVEPPVLTNFVAEGDKKALAKMIVNGQPVYVMTENDGYLQAYTVDPPGNLTSIN
ncbi:MAG: VCBS repeat-containing protein, partial [Cyclobacteriaceae bacterium]|nr:VCBS repeat-containing protein [Cyclobacteriaceae bacterium]